MIAANSSDPYYVIHGEGYAAPNKDASGNPLSNRTYSGLTNMNHKVYTSEVIDKNLNPSWSAHVLETGRYTPC